jgi:hypothetical protein
MTAQEKAELDPKAKEAGISTSGYVRQMVCEKPFKTGADLLKLAEQHMGDQRLRIRRRK